ncbi:MAG: ATP-binding cassette domain-containing protein [Gammaproteobacteria bacterium]|jgi:ABC-2 type transport system ATP-binding protein
MSSQPLISVHNLVRYYGDNCAVDNISFELAAGDILGFLGPNGAGKSTTMQMLSGNLAPTEGEIQINGIDLLEQPGKAKSALGYLPETPPLYREMSVDEYLRYCAKLRRINKTAISNALALAKQRCGLTDTGKRLIGNLSKGFQQRVGIAQAILHSPQVIILDEPTVGLDPIQIREIRELIIELGKSHGIILSTHILPEVESVCNRVQIINAGKLVYASDMKGLQAHQHTGKYELSLVRPPAVADIDAIDFIDQVEQVDSNSFIVYTTSPADELAAIAVHNNWGLTRLVPHEHSLEQIFVNLTLGDGADA